MNLSDFDYFLPEALIAQEPEALRDQSRLLVLYKESGSIEHKRFSDCVQYFSPGDLLVINSTRVIPARLLGVKEATGANIEVVLLRRRDRDTWEALVKPGKRVPVGTRIIFGDGMLVAEAMDVTDVGGRILKFSFDGIFEEILDQLGQMPLPPYIKKQLDDRERYQTVYSKTPGSAAAPTAGLHFTPELLERLKNQGINTAEVTLHVGLGTFRPVKCEQIEGHKMHAEYYEMSEASAQKINAAKEKGCRIISVGTTSTRVLETLAEDDGRVKAGSGWTDIFIYPGYRFKVVDTLITNFHLPKSTLLMLVSAFAGREKVLKAYETAVENEYRFFSFGDAMLIL